MKEASIETSSITAFPYSILIGIIVLGIFCYVIGSIPFGYVIGRLKGIDIRKHGSGNVGASNIARTLGYKYGLLVFTLDFLKGFIPALVINRVFSNSQEAHDLVYGFGCFFLLLPILGNSFPFYMGFKGGKAVSCSAGILAYSSIITFLITFCIFIAIFLTKRIVSISSLGAAVSLPIVAIVVLYLENERNISFFLENSYIVQEHPYQFIIVVIILCLIVRYRHLENMLRFVKGKEFSFKENKNK